MTTIIIPIFLICGKYRINPFNFRRHNHSNRIYNKIENIVLIFQKCLFQAVVVVKEGIIHSPSKSS